MRPFGGILVLAAGQRRSFLPPLVITKQHAETAIDILDEALTDISNS